MAILHPLTTSLAMYVTFSLLAGISYAYAKSIAKSAKEDEQRNRSGNLANKSSSSTSKGGSDQVVVSPKSITARQKIAEKGVKKRPNSPGFTQRKVVRSPSIP